MLKIKLQRVGKKHQPSFRLVVAERRSKLDGPPVEYLGSYSVSAKKADFDKDRISHWLKVGARPTVTVHNLLIKEGIISGSKFPVKIKKARASEAVNALAQKTEETVNPPAETGEMPSGQD